MDLSKFVAMLQTRSLFFARADTFDDKFEGSTSISNFKARQDALAQANVTYDQRAELARDILKIIFINCWHMSEFESAAMWKLYSQSSNAICVQTTFAL
jgi:hypothetical protein